jgi:transposase
MGQIPKTRRKKMISIGIDWADDKHDVCVRDNEDRRILAVLTISNDAAGVAELDELVAMLGYQAGECLVAIEKPSGLLVGYLLQQGYLVYAIQPQAVDRYRDRHHAAGSKTDPIDAATLADILCIDREYHRPIPADSPLAQEIKLVSRHRQKLVAERTGIKNQLTACLKAYYPVALKLFTDLDLAIAWAFLRTYPNAQVASQTSLADLKVFFAQQGYTCKQKIPGIFKQLQAAAIPVSAWQIRAYQRQMLVLVDLLSALQPQILAYERELSNLLDQHEDAFIFRSLPNAGVITAAWLLGEIGDCRDKFQNSTGMQALAGSCPVTRQSNKRRTVKFRTACCKPFRNGIHQFARLSTHTTLGAAWARGYVRDQLDRGHNLNRARRALANRWLSIIFRLWKDRIAYDEKVHLRNRALKGRLLRLDPVSMPISQEA